MNIAAAAGEHLLLVLVAVGLAALLGLPAAIWAARNPRPGNYLLRTADLVQTIPALALFGLLLPVIGIGPRMAVVALFAYALLPILRNTVAGLGSVPEAVKEAAVAMGLTPRQVLREVELPLAAPSIVAGLRIATVTTIGTATVAAAVGAGGLGTFLYRGLATLEPNLLLAGAIPAALMAILADWILGWIENKLSQY
ncbi:MAG: ABC transporter permease [Bryobacteraceae bacterium]|nr:ABC transporter permease [Bryobacteraceae bacterium]